MNFKRTNLIISLMLAMFLAAVEGTIVTMATPTIAKDLHGFEIISMVFSVYLLTSAISTPIYGKLADLYGRKNIFSIGIIIFLVGSFLCGLSQSMAMLIIFRAVQGLGAGSIFTVSYTIIGDTFNIEERSKIQGGLNTVWGIASLVGPFLGGFLIDTLSWHWIFFINIPFGLLSIILLQRSLKETYEKKKHCIDYIGTITLSLAMIVFLSIFLFNQNSAFNHHVFTVIAALITGILLVIFYKLEKKAKEPMMPFDIFTRASIIVNLISFLVYAILMGVNVYLPIFLQNIQGYRPITAGLAMMPMSVSWLITSLILGKLLSRYGEKAVTVASNVVLLISTLLLSTLGIDSHILLVIIYGFIIGIGFSGASTTLTIVIQDSVNYNKRGVAVAANTLLRTLGQTIGISAFGNIFNLYITKYFIRQGIKGINPSNLYQSSASHTSLSAEQVKLSLNSSMHVLFIAFIFISCLSLVLSIVMPKIRGENKVKEG
ncbi:MDR family MFS transporter [Clostridium luticellarii]|uniref:Multidrug resistance protein 3 n=1 Tax=Clostridium luticellarii TaxID=1691940 RepID=A0A2T0BI07_9CLOT|nr:MDR family MFS transporter [Clostridium luticellarii]MCI1945985.1 MFS transporter [Clostridium luticellarii]MCI1969658.1 MFS transporter [Clostridium luticellarii]MCI1996647.1 MFS transporter [Clostridium luticellarii]MCI2039573.1 MFS transporter [Clostridium luticellarii]PRR83491.1 Multidrug resistance protein 3 [Clostridium luticellarii]